MDNKNDKTFADLFSSVTTESEKEATTQTFSDILKGSNEDKEPKEESTSSVTFDSLFDQMPKKEESKSDLSEQPKLDNNKIETKIETPEVEDKAEKTTANLESNSNNPFFSNETEETPNEIEMFTSEEVNQTQEPKKQEPEQTEFNPLFTENKEIESSIENNTSDESSTINSEAEITEEKEETSQIDNLFFQASESVEENTTPEKEKDKESTISNDDKINNTSEAEPKEEKTDFDSNPFINAEPVSTTSEPEATPDTNIEIGPIFKETTNEPTEQKSIENPFFEDKETNKEENSITETSEKSLTTKKEDKSQEELVPKSTSPFFEEEKKVEENPLFQTQINLIENQLPNTPNGNIDTSKTKHYNVKIVKKKEPLIKFILGVLSYALFIWLLLIGITLLVYVLDIKIRAAKGDYSSPTFNAYVVLTGSMLPEIQVYDVVITKKVEAEKLQEGDVITFASADSRFLGTIITHRIIKKNPSTATEGYTFQTKGDNNNVADNALVPENNIYGKVILRIPKLGYLQEFLASDGGWIIVILIPCLTVISYDIVKLMKGLKRKKYKNIKVQK